MLLTFLKEKIFLLVLLASFLIALSLTIACWHMNPWPSDAEVYYMPAAKNLFQHQYLSQMHHGLDEERIKWLHGKEMHVLAIALLQQWMRDTVTLRPLLVLGALAIFISSVLIYLICRKLWGKSSAVIVWFLFTTSFWPYLYVLFTKHQTQGLMFFLLSVLCIIMAKRVYMVFIAGMCLGVAIFSSTVSMLYVPLIAAALLLDKKKFVLNGLLFGAGFMAVVVYVNWPDVLGNLKSYAQYVNISGAMNHFFYNQTVLVQWLPNFDLKNTRGGLVWVVKYLWLVIPVIVVVYGACVYQILWRDKKHALGILAFSVAAIAMAEFKGVAQYGANYFPVLLGMLMVIGYAMRNSVFQPWWLCIGLVSLLWNVNVMANDIYPSRMVTTRISDFLEKNNIHQIYTFRQHVLRPNILDHLNPSTLANLTVTPIESVVQVSKGYILLPPISTDSIYRASNGDYNDFDSDLMLNTIVRQGKINHYAVAGFRTLSSSLIWSQEEEIFAYRYLMLDQFHDSALHYAWILDANKIANDKALLMPTAEDVTLLQTKVKNIGTQARQQIFTGYQGGVAASVELKGLAVRIYKLGNPQDELRAYVFKLDEKQPMWVPYAPAFKSKPLHARDISLEKDPQPSVFMFDPPLTLNPGPFFVVIYRNGKPSDQDYYRIYSDVMGRLE